MICYSFKAPIYFFFSPDMPSLFYYSHIPTILIAIFAGFLVFSNGRKILLNKLLFAISVCFSLWTLSNLILWTNIHSDLMLFTWSFLRIISSIMSILSIYFIYVFLDKKDISIKTKIIFLILLLPVIILAPTNINLSGFNLTSCDAFMFEGVLFQIYRVIFGILAMIWILILLIKKYKKAEINFKKQIVLVGTGIELFLFSFFIVTFLAAYFTKIGLFSDSRLEYYGLFSIVIFVVYLSILIVRFNAFNVKIIATQALVYGLAFLVGSQFFFIQQKINFILNGITFAGTIILGQYLILSVKKEIQQREYLEKLRINLEDTNNKLESANERLKGLDQLKTEFVSLASHQLRSPLTAIKGYTSMLLEGDYGELPVESKETVGRIFESSQSLAKIVEDLLNVSKIEQGGMKYEMAPFDMVEVAQAVSKDLSIVAENKGLKLNFLSEGAKNCMVNGDREKIRQVILNFIDNSIKYTKKGSIDVKVERLNNKVLFSVSDTGMGIPDDIKETLFHKFSRGDGARMNTSGSGLGLYLAKEIAKAHNGHVWVESNGVDKGSTFYLDMNAVK